MGKRYWAIKSEPESYSWEDLVKDGKTAWTGVRNFQARNNLRTMKAGDIALFYHSNTGKEFVGLAEVAKEAYPDPTAKEGDWTAVDFAPKKPLKKPVTLDALKKDADLKNLGLVRNSRISVSPVTDGEFRRILELAGE